MTDRKDFLEYMKDVYGKFVYAPKIEDELDKFYNSIKNCKKCGLSETRNCFVFGGGNHHADIMFVGEAPGAREDETGVPFVGRAGKVLDKIFEELGLTRDDVFIANVLKCRPPANRDPLPDEIALCEPYLHKQIELIKPKVLVALGRISANTLMRTSYALKDMRQKTFNYRDTDLRVLYHPAAICRNANLYDTLLGDMKYIVDHYLN